MSIVMREAQGFLERVDRRGSVGEVADERL